MLLLCYEKGVMKISIHVSRRNLSRTQYEDSFRTIRNHLRQRVERVPKRRWITVARPFLEAVNDAFEVIMGIEEDPVTGTKTAAQTRYARILEAQKRIKKMEPPLWVLWNICGDPDEQKMKHWKDSSRANICDLVNEKVLTQLHDMQVKSSKYRPEEDKGMTKLRYYTEQEIDKAEFLSVLRELHRITHGKVLRLNVVARDAEGSLRSGKLTGRGTAPCMATRCVWLCRMSGNCGRSCFQSRSARCIRHSVRCSICSALAVIRTGR